MRIESGVKDFAYTPTQTIGQNRTDSIEKKDQISDSNLKNQRLHLQEAIKSATEKSNQPADEHEVIQAIEKANKHIRVYDRRLEFSIHDMTKQIMVKVINTETEEVIREIPSEKILDMVGHLWQLAGILVDEKR